MNVADSALLGERKLSRAHRSSDATPTRRGMPGWLPYGVTATAFVLFMVPVCVRLPWCGDIGQHAATIWRLRQDLVHPRSPLIDVPGDGSPYFSPYTVLGALLCRATGWTPLQVLHVLAMGNVLLIVAGVGALVRALADRVWAPVLALLCYVFLWGFDLRLWSGYESLVSLCFGVCFPSALGAGGSMLVMAWTLRLLGRVPGATRAMRPRGMVRRPAEHAGLGLLAAVVLLSHVFTGVPMLLGVAAILIGSWEALTPRDGICWAVSAAAGLGVLLAWPYWNVFDLRQDAGLDSIHWWLYDQMIPWIGLALMLGVPALVARFRRDRRDPLVLLFLLCGAAVVYGWVSGHYSWGRLTPALVLAAQLATAIELARLGGRRWRRSAYALTAATALLLGAWVQAGAVLLVLPRGTVPKSLAADIRQITPWNGFAWMSPYVHAGDVVMTADNGALDVLPAYGWFTVQAGYPDPAVPRQVLAQRGADTAAFFAWSSSEATRVALLERYRAHWILATRASGVPTGPSYRVVAYSRIQGAYLIRFQSPAARPQSR